MKFTAPKPVLKPDTIYLGDNGMAICCKCAGQSALYTGRDISGQKVMRVRPEDLAEISETSMACECGAVTINSKGATA